MKYLANGGLERCRHDIGTIFHDAWTQPVGDGYWVTTERGIERLSGAIANHDPGDQDDGMDGFRPVLRALADAARSAA